MKCITLTLNPAFDRHCYIRELRIGYEHLAETDSSDAGGKGVNISRALTVNGIKNNTVVVLGRENKDAFCAALDADKMAYTAITIDGKVRENLTVHTESGETRISFKGFTADDSLLDEIYNKIKADLDADTILTFTGSVPQGMTISAVNAFLKKASDMGARLVIDSKSFKTLEEIAALRPWLIKPNGEEISEYLGREINTHKEIFEVAKKLHTDRVQNVMISLGSKGAMLVSKDGAYICTPPKIEAKSTIGAGDSSIAGFIAAAMEGKTTAEALKQSVAWGSAACMREGTLPPLGEDIRFILNNINIETI